MGIGEIIILIIVGVVLFAVFSMRKKQPLKNADQNSNPGSSPGQQDTRYQRSGRGGGYGKWIGGGLGWVFGGPIGVILGLALGSMFDGMNKGKFTGQETPRGDFTMSLLVLSAVVMKADKRIVRSELDFVRNFFISQFGEEEGSRQILMLREILKQEINVQEVSRQVGQYMDYPVRLQLMHYLFGIAAADGNYHPDEVDMIETIAGFMGIYAADFASLKAMFVKSAGWAYDVLEITSSATNEEVKKAYREMAKKHHPDKVSTLGEDVKRAATEKFQKIGAAYEEIKKQRGLK